MPPTVRNNKHCSTACVNCSNRKKRCSGTGPTCTFCAARGLQAPVFPPPCTHIGRAPALPHLQPNALPAAVPNPQLYMQLIQDGITFLSNFVWLELTGSSGAVCTPVNVFGAAIPPLVTGGNVLHG
ncbi:hypothetical protein AURDEDRAFT_170242 [Auricularia subglabra TFB-10046 SS5]|nr:hypothetical protein AURDEDRAFT_170242 [Auricularia subglabra TFB-10046 SS5]